MTEREVTGIGTEWLTTNEAADLTGYSAAYVRMLARRGAVDAVRAGRDWLVQREAVLAYQRQMDALGTDKHNPWREDREDLAEQGRGRIE